MLRSGFMKALVLGSGFLVVSIMLLASATSAEETPSADSTKAPVYLLKETVVTANRYEQDAFKLPQSVSIISKEEIQKENPQIVADLLRVLPGVEVNDAGPFRTRPVIRGLYGSRVLILVDGERLNDTRESTFSGAQLSLIDIRQL